MRILIITSFALVFCNTGFSQKVLDSTVFGKWPYVEKGAISDDGKYVLYFDVEPKNNFNELIVKSTEGKWVNRFKNIANASFTPDNRCVIFDNNDHDSLWVLRLGTDSVKFIRGARSFKILANGWFIYQSNLDRDNVWLYNYLSDDRRVFDNVIDFQVGKAGKMIAFKRTARNDTNFRQRIELLNLELLESKEIWMGDSARNFIFNDNEDKIAFLIKETSRMTTKNAFCVYDIAQVRLSEIGVDSFQTANNLVIERITKFSSEYSQLFFQFTRIRRPTPEVTKAKVTVWSYNDAKLQSQQLIENNVSETYLGVLSLANHQMAMLENENEIFWDVPGQYGLLYHKSKNAGSSTEGHWNAKARNDIYLINRSNLKTEKIFSEVPINIYPTVSADSKYLVYYDFEKHNYISYSIGEKMFRCVTENISTNWESIEEDEALGSKSLYGLLGWIKNSSVALIYDQDDIWKIDFSGKLTPVCLTNRYGIRHDIKFRLMRQGGSQLPVFLNDDKLFLLAFDRRSKANGFFEITLANGSDPKLLSMGANVYEIPHSTLVQKAVNDNTYLVQRMSVAEAPNYFVTHDFRTFTTVSNIAPQKDYNWFTTELHHWRGLDGSLLRGILYKPQNFESTKKYPVIIFFYEKLSHMLNFYLTPDASEAALNIPYFVSKGYLIFCPDIIYTRGRVGMSASNSVISAAKYLARYSFVDPSKIGLQGASHGGFETNYIITHSKLFSAACAAAGPTDWVSSYSEISTRNAGASEQVFHEEGQPRMGSGLGERPDVYIRREKK